MVSQPTLTTPPRAARTAAFGFIFGSALINAISFGIMIPILPNLIKQFVGGDTAAASEWNVLFSTVWGVMQFVCGPILGMLSDRYGRRPVLLLSISGLFVDFLFMAFAPTLPWLFLGRVLNGVTASSFSTANAYVADITPPQERARNFGLMGSAFGFGFIIGPTLGGVLGEISLRLPFIVAAGLCLINALYGLFILPESLPPERRTPAVNWARANPLGSLRFLRERPQLGGLALVGFLYQLGFTVLPAIFVLYSGYRYGWTPAILGLTFLATGVSQILVAAFVVGPVVKRVGERGAVLLGLGSGALGLLIYSLAPNGWIYMAGVPAFALTGLVNPGLQGLMTRRVGPQHQGQLQGVFQSFQGIASVVGPPLFGLTFAWAVRHDGALHQPGLPILIASALFLGAFLLSIRVATPAPATAPA
ncbi:MAG: major facilitator superfamily transporter [Caulobacteraceae bacterium]|nr:major facilitator superfamily transporter [Caulobacteraceae bacterium]